MNELEKLLDSYGLEVRDSGEYIRWNKFQSHLEEKKEFSWVVDEVFAEILGNEQTLIIKDIDKFVEKFQLEKEIPLIFRPVFQGAYLLYSKDEGEIYNSLRIKNVWELENRLDAEQWQELKALVNPEYRLAALFHPEEAEENLMMAIEEKVEDKMEHLIKIDLLNFKKKAFAAVIKQDQEFLKKMNQWQEEGI